MSFLRPMVSAPPEGVFPVLDKMNLPADAALIGVIMEEQMVLICGYKGFQSVRNPIGGYFTLGLRPSLRRNGVRCSIGSFFLRRIRQQTHRHEQDCHDRQQTHPEAGAAIVENCFDPVLHADLSEGHGACGVVGPAGGAAKQSGGVAFPFLQLHELHHPLVTGQLNVPAQQDVGRPHQRVEPVQGQRQKADHLEPVVALFQMGALVGQDVPAHRGA